MKTYYVLWTYIANYSDTVWAVDAESPEHAEEKIRNSMSKDFKKKANIFVFDNPPAYASKKGKPLGGEDNVVTYMHYL